ncbi:MAG: hypothetical protein A2Y25_09610 [Candidatus Melainabacteria bacterium GWF2_37_15]|nr:MAG: hypothetical protein A2Y25_09610 [Candidatus Melainabacteria bacterium GWF2_37_15]
MMNGVTPTFKGNYQLKMKTISQGNSYSRYLEDAAPSKVQVFHDNDKVTVLTDDKQNSIADYNLLTGNDWTDPRIKEILTGEQYFNIDEHFGPSMDKRIEMAEKKGAIDLRA